MLEEYRVHTHSKLSDKSSCGLVSEERKAKEREGWVNTTAEAMEYLREHSDTVAAAMQRQVDLMQEQQTRVFFQYY